MEAVVANLEARQVLALERLDLELLEQMQELEKEAAEMDRLEQKAQNLKGACRAWERLFLVYIRTNSCTCTQKHMSHMCPVHFASRVFQ